MSNYLLFFDDADDAVAYKADRLYSMICPSNALINLKFESSIGSAGTDGASADTVALTITADKEQEVMSTLIKAIKQKNTDYIIVADDRTAAATTILSVEDGDATAVGVVAEKEYITFTDTAGTSKTYAFVDDNATTVATGDILSASSDTGASTAGSDLNGAIAVAINLTGSVANQWKILDQLEDAIAHSNGHNGTIVCSDLDGAAADGKQSMNLTQNVA